MHKFKAFSFTIEEIRHDQSFSLLWEEEKGGEGEGARLAQNIHFGE